MSLFPRSYLSPETSFTPLFRLLDDFDSYSREVAPNRQGNDARRHLPTFSPRFDVKETEGGYELHGEIPGAEKDKISIEFTEPQTIVISGRTERSYTSGTPPIGLVEGGATMSGAITNGNDNNNNNHHNNSHKATVEDEAAAKAKEQGTEVAKHDQHKQEQQRPRERFWVSERSVGEFSRTFSFPTPVDQDNVAANLKDGVLSVHVPKAKKQEGRRIAVN